MRSALLSAATAIVAFLTPGEPAAANPQHLDSQLEILWAQDRLLAGLAFRLTSANASLCTEVMPATGAVLHARNQYRAGLSGLLPGFSAPLAIAAIVRGSPADQAGLRAGDGIASVSGIAPPPEDGDGMPDTGVRDGFERQLVTLSPNAPMAWQVLRGGSPLTVAVAPLPACRVRFEVVPGEKLVARNNGELIQLGAGYFTLLDADLLAAVVAHELAHSVLLHRRRLAAAGVSKGLLAEFGRSGRLNRRVEREADRLSVHLLRNAGYDPALAVRLWERHGTRISGGLLRSRTHDSPAERAARLRTEIAAIPPAAPVPFSPALIATREDPLQ